MPLVCSTCKETKKEDEFHKNSRTKSGYANACKGCMKEYKRAWYYENGGQNYERVYGKRYSKEKTLKTSKWKRLNPERRMWSSLKRSAKDRGLEFNLDWTDIVIPDVCPILGLRLKIGNSVTSADSPSMDRIDNSKGYVKGNVRVISHRANALKSNLTIEQARSLLRYMEGLRK